MLPTLWLRERRNTGAADGPGSVLQGSGVEQVTEDSPLISMVFLHCRTSEA